MDEFTVSTKYWHKLENGKVECDICPRHCQLKEGQHGFCAIRAAEEDQIVLKAYGRTTGLAIDPIEKKPLNHFYPGSSVLSFGTIGCNLGCQFCQNWQTVRATDLNLMGVKAMPDDIVELALRNQCQSIAFTYNEPTIFFEYAVDTAIAAKKQNLKTIAVTNGYIEKEPRIEFYRYMDAANIDLKAFTDDFYRKITLSALDPVLETLLYVKNETDTWLEVTNLLIPGFNDSEKEIHALVDWFGKHLGSDVPLHFSGFYPCYKMMDVQATPVETLEKARHIALDAGLHYVYTGNRYDPEGNTTYCPHCKEPVIERNNFIVSSYQIEPGSKCAHCQKEISGRFRLKMKSGRREL